MTTATATAVRAYQIDLTHSEASFQVRHLLSKVRGHFAEFAGAIEFDETDPVRSRVTFEALTSSITTSQPDRDAHLQSDDFFASERFPKMTFVSRTITSRGGQQYDVVGDLTIRDVTRTITLPVSYLGKAKDPWGNEKLAFEAEITLNRKDFGLNWNAALETGGFLVGDDVKVSLNVQAVAKS